MEAIEDKNKQNDAKQQISLLEKAIKSAFKEGNYEAVKVTAYKIKALDPDNRLAEKMINKAEKVRKKAESVEKAKKAKEYATMLKKLYKEQNVEKLTALANEFKAFDPESKDADKWIKKSEKLKDKLSGKKEEKQPGFFANLFKKSNKQGEPEKKEGLMQIVAKKEEEASMKIEAKPEAIKPIAASITPIAPIVSQPAPTTPAPVVTTKPVEKVAPKKEETAPKETKGNIFTKIFSKKEEVTDKKSIIDTIVAKTDKKEEQKAPENEMGAKQDEENNSQKLLTFSKVFMNFALIFIVFSAAFLYVEWVDKENTLLSLVGFQHNTGERLHSASEEVISLKKQETTLNTDIELYKGGYDDKAVSTVDQIIADRINWPDIFSKINEVTNSVYELNDFFKYIEYNNYSFDVEKKAIRVTGSLSDPLGRNLTKLVELEEAFIFYPNDRSNPDDMTEPYFSGFEEFTSFSKTLDADTGRYTSSFQLSFSLND